MQARAAAEAGQLRGQVFDQQRLVREREAALSSASNEIEELHARVAMLQQTVTALEAARAAVLAEMSPVKRQALGLEQELSLQRQHTQTADMRASTESTLRSQAELSLSQLQMRLAAMEADCDQLRSTNQELLQAKSDAEQELDGISR